MKQTTQEGSIISSKLSTLKCLYSNKGIFATKKKHPSSEFAKKKAPPLLNWNNRQCLWCDSISGSIHNSSVLSGHQGNPDERKELNNVYSTPK